MPLVQVARGFVALFIFFAASVTAIGAAQAQSANLSFHGPRTPQLPSIPGPGGFPSGVIWTNQNQGGSGTMTASGVDTSTVTTFNPSGYGSSLTVTVENGSVAYSDGTDRFSVQTNYLGGYTVTRTKAGYSGIERGVYNAQGSLVSSLDSLQVPASDAFVAGLTSMQGFVELNGGSYAAQTSGMSASAPGGNVVTALAPGCADAMIWGGLQIVGSALGIAVSWFGGPVAGVIGTIAGAAAMHDAAEDITSACFPQQASILENGRPVPFV